MGWLLARRRHKSEHDNAGWPPVWGCSGVSAGLQKVVASSTFSRFALPYPALRGRIGRECRGKALQGLGGWWCSFLKGNGELSTPASSTFLLAPPEWWGYISKSGNDEPEILGNPPK